MIAGTIVEDILRVINRANDQDMRNYIWRILRTELLEICRQFSVVALRTNATLDFSESDKGMLLPSDLLGIDMVRDQFGVEFFERNQSDIESSEYGHRFYRYNPSSVGLHIGDDVNITHGGNSFVSQSLSDLNIKLKGEYVRFGDGFEYYKILSDESPFEIEPVYYGSTIVDGFFVVRPPETQRMVILDPIERELKNRKITVYYWKAPAGLYLPTDRIPLPSTEALVLKILRRLPEAKENRPVSATELEKAMNNLRNINPDFPRTPSPRDKHNNLFTFKQDVFARR